MTEQDYEAHYEPAEPTAVTREAADAANQVTRAIYALKTPPPTGSEHYRSGWDTGLEAAADTACDAVLAATASQAAEIERLRTMLDEYRCTACGGEGGGGTMDPDVWIDCQTCRGTGRTARLAATTWTIEVLFRGEWKPFTSNLTTPASADDSYQAAIAGSPDRAFRLVRSDTVHTITAEYTPSEA